MADKKPPQLDPSAQFQEYVTQWERSVDQFFNRLMGTDEFTQSMNQFQRMQLELQKNFSEFMAGYLSNLNMPSREEVIAIGENLREIEARLARMEVKIDQMAGVNEPPDLPQPARKNPPRTKQPPSKEA